MSNQARWNGNSIVGRLMLNGVETEVAADRETVHRHAPGYSDAITWELERFAEDILDRLKPYFEALEKAKAA